MSSAAPGSRRRGRGFSEHFYAGQVQLRIQGILSQGQSELAAGVMVMAASGLVSIVTLIQPGLIAFNGWCMLVTLQSPLLPPPDFPFCLSPVAGSPVAIFFLVYFLMLYGTHSLVAFKEM